MSQCTVSIWVSFLIATNSNWKTESQQIDFNKNEFGDHLTFAVFHNPPFDVLTFNSDGNYSYTGFSPLLHVWLAEKLHFRISYTVLNNTNIGQSGSRSIVEYAVRLLITKKVDALINGLTATPERKKWVDFTYMIWTEPWTMLVPRPGEESRLFAFTKPFQSKVWLLILLATITVVCVMTLFSKFYFKPISHNDLTPSVKSQKSTIFYYSGSFNFMYILNVLTNQGGEHPTVRLSFRVLIGVWLLMATVIVNSYSSTVISYLTIPKLKRPINTFEDLASSKDVGILLYEDLIISKQILEAKSGALKILGDQARNNPDRLFTDSVKLNARLVTGQYAYPYVQTFCKFYVVNQFKKDGKCRFRITDPLPIQPGFFSIVLQKHSKFTSMFNRAVMELWETGLVPFWLKVSLPHAPQCFVQPSQETTTHLMPISLKDLKGAFFIFAIGVALSAFTFLAENIFHFRKRWMAAASE